jgi:hypothetical protein
MTSAAKLEGIDSQPLTVRFPCAQACLRALSRIAGASVDG